MASANLGLTTLTAGQASAEVSVNEALNRVDALVFLAFVDRDTPTPPGSPAEGVAYLPAANVWAIGTADTGSNFFKVTGDQTAIIDNGDRLTVSGSTGNDGTYTVTTTSYSAPDTTINVTENVADATADGNINHLEDEWNYDSDNSAVPLNQVAYYAGGWLFVTPKEGWIARVLDENILTQYDGTSWQAIATGADEQTVSTRIDNPEDDDQAPLFYTTQAITISEVRSIVAGTSSPDVTWNVMHAADRSAAGTQVFGSDQTTSSTTTGDVDTPSGGDETIPAGRFVWIEIEGVPTGTVTSVEWFVKFTQDAP